MSEYKGEAELFIAQIKAELAALRKVAEAVEASLRYDGSYDDYKQLVDALAQWRELVKKDNK